MGALVEVMDLMPRRLGSDMGLMPPMEAMVTKLSRDKDTVVGQLAPTHGLDIVYVAGVCLMYLVMTYRSVQTCCCCPTARETSRVAIGLTALALHL